MNKRSVRQFWDIVIALVLSLILFFVSDEVAINLFGLEIIIALIPLMWLGFRHGAPSTIISGFFVGIIQGLVDGELGDWLVLISQWVAPLLAVGVTGLFAKYTQKTLNNKRYSSTYLNIFTGSLLALILFIAIRQMIVPFALGEELLFEFNNLNHWLGLLISWLLSAGVLLLLARFVPQTIIPKRSKYLSRKETSSLLND
ncbi:energy-coupled thiamine transporter ThiT [Facklamia sp. 7083-14-GEN3]|uniref:energy-coupled thiamine transporter ThiT n=1 Tax=Facklamia sp. 7083-14-GEN3 TaxID=2973478 RepID=UPI00215CF16D|nr:energy-coupled thiamine transporter ThiT [Facklamia sp. 7083-14-GEN3]MCR8969021.1 energy-coupled thiamine transporter ThiT [Facklamia sp. 7083-14-GEN3]